MEAIVAEVENEQRSRDNSSFLLDNFLESQRNSLKRLKYDIERLERLKSQARAQPFKVFKEITMGTSQRHLKHTEAIRELDVAVPNLDWSLFTQTGDPPRTLPPTSSSRAHRLRSEMAEFNSLFADLSPLPADLLDSAENNDKKRKRAESTSRRPSSLSTLAPSGGLRLPSSRPTSSFPVRSSTLVSEQQFLEPNFRMTPNSDHHKPNSTQLPDLGYAPHIDGSAQRPNWAAKATTTSFAASSSNSRSRSRSNSPVPEVELPSVQQETNHAPQVTQEELSPEPSSIVEDLPATFKKNWTLEEQHTLERLLTEIPSTVKFRWVKISEAMGGTRTPRQVASRVQKYYEKMKKLGVAIDSTEMGGGGRGGSKATQGLDAPTRKSSSSRQSTRGMPKSGPQYTKSGRRR